MKTESRFIRQALGLALALSLPLALTAAAVLHTPDISAQAPAAPTGLEATPGPSSITLTWDDPNDSSVVHYAFGINSGGTVDMIGSHGGTTSYTFRDLSPNYRYTFRLHAVSGGRLYQDAGVVIGPAATIGPITPEPGRSRPDAKTSTETSVSRTRRTSRPTKRPTPTPAPTPTPTPTPKVVGATGAATVSELPGNRLLIQRHDVPDTSVELALGSISADGTTVVPAGVIRESPLGQTYLVLRRESDDRIVRRWVPFYSRLAGQIPWPMVNARYTFPTNVIIAIRLDDQSHQPYMLVRRFDGDDDRIFAFDPTIRQWRHVPDIPTFQSLFFYWCDVIAADAGFFERLTPGPAYPPSPEPERADYPTCRTGQPVG